MTVAIIEDQSLFLGFLRTVCEKELGYRVVGGVETGAAGIALCRVALPDLILLDLGLPDRDGLDIVPELRAVSPRSRILAISGCADECTHLRIPDSGVDGFVDKNRYGASVESLAAAVEEVMTTGCHWDPVVNETRRRIFRDAQSWTKRLTVGEQELLGLLGAGMSDEEAAAKLQRSPRTIRWRRQVIMSKLGLHQERELVCFARAKGLTRVRDSVQPWPGLDG